jgi:hypothetical protein
MSTLSVCLVGSALLLSGGASAQLVFEPQVVGGSTTGTFTPRLDLGDVDGDGDIDAVFSTDTDSVFHDYEVMLNDGSGKLASASSVSVTPGIWSLKLLPFDADPELDLLTAQANSIFLRRGLGNGSFAAPQLIFSGGHPNIGRIEALDMTGDGVPDLVVLQGGKITLLPATGDGGVGAPMTVGDVAPPFAYAARAADLDGNGQVDLVVSARDLYSVPSHPASVIHVFLGRGSGDFDEWASYFIGDLADVELMALAGDSALDLVCSSVSGVEVWTGLGTGGFQFATQLEPGSYGTGLAVADFDDDGLLDVASVLKTTREVVFWRQDDEGGLQENLRLSHADPSSFGGEPPFYTRPMMAADMDGDGKVDLVRTVTDEFGQVQVFVFRNHTYGPDEPFLDLGLSLTDPSMAAPSFEYPGQLVATPVLLLDGTMQPGTPVRFRVFRHGVEPEVGWLLLGFSPLLAPAFGGTMVPTPSIIFGPLVLPGFDSVADISTTMPEGVPPGMQFWLQAWFPPVGPYEKHYSATSGVRLTAP